MLDDEGKVVTRVHEDARLDELKRIEEEEEEKGDEETEEYRALRKEVRLLEIALLEKHPELQQSHLIHDEGDISTFKQEAILKNLKYELEFFALKYIELCMDYAKGNLAEFKVLKHNSGKGDFSYVSPLIQGESRKGYIESMPTMMMSSWMRDPENRSEYLFNRIMTLAHELTHTIQSLDYTDTEGYNIINSLYESMRKDLLPAGVITESDSMMLEQFISTAGKVLTGTEAEIRNLMRHEHLSDFHTLISKEKEDIRKKEKGEPGTLSDREKFILNYLKRDRDEAFRLLRLETNLIKRIGGLGLSKRDKSAYTLWRVEQARSNTTGFCGAYENLYKFENIIEEQLGREAHATFMEAFLLSLSACEAFLRLTPPATRGNAKLRREVIFEALEEEHISTISERIPERAEENYIGYQLFKLGLASLSDERLMKFIDDGIEALGNNKLEQFLTTANECFRETVEKVITEPLVHLKSEELYSGKKRTRRTKKTEKASREIDFSFSSKEQFCRRELERTSRGNIKDMSLVGKALRQKQRSKEQSPIVS